MKRWMASLILALVPLASGAGERFACNLNALTRTERAAHQKLGEAVRERVREQKELKNGYAFRLDAEALPTAAQWVAFESRCCPFFTFEIEVARDRGPVWLRITGSDGVKAFMREELGLS